MNTKASKNNMKKKKSFAPPGFETWTVQPVA
jgi:hypothetical protein